MDGLEQLQLKGLKDRNRLFHSLYWKHNLRRNSDEGRTRMLEDLDNIHDTLFNAYKAVLLVNGIDLDAHADEFKDMVLPTAHLSI